jgi:hypothetical protein
VLLLNPELPPAEQKVRKCTGMVTLENEGAPCKTSNGTCVVCNAMTLLLSSEIGDVKLLGSLNTREEINFPGPLVAKVPGALRHPRHLGCMSLDN